MSKLTRTQISERAALRREYRTIRLDRDTAHSMFCLYGRPETEAEWKRLNAELLPLGEKLKTFGLTQDQLNRI